MNDFSLELLSTSKSRYYLSHFDLQEQGYRQTILNIHLPLRFLFKLEQPKKRLYITIVYSDKCGFILPNEI